MRQSGLTLIEVLVVVAILGILLAIGTIDFRTWAIRYNVERQIKELQSDLMTARVQAKNRNRAHFVVLGSNQYVITDDTDDNGSNDATDTVLVSRVGVRNAMQWSNAGETQFVFSKRGLSEFAGADKTICVFSTAGPSYDCLVITPSRINAGKIINQAGGCTSANCGEK
jgi:prepilin-type N-terminal cleavage/methylation domain-containing protein